MQIISQCSLCIHGRAGTARCAAFQSGKPNEIFFNEVDHRSPYKGDNGIQWEWDPLLSGNPWHPMDHAKEEDDQDDDGKTPLD